MSLDEHYREALRELAADLDGIDIETYRRFDKDPLEPIIGLGDPDLRIGVLGRDPGREEVRHGEPFIGAGGQLVRRTAFMHLYGQSTPDFAASRALGRLFFWCNTVPYKPSGNKAWSMKIKKRFHPVMRALLVDQWRGKALITLGREAFLWFGIGQSREERARIEAFWKREDRFESSIEMTLDSDSAAARCLTLYPLPHPSPLNATWYARFPGLLQARLTELDARPDNLTRACCPADPGS